ncbi:hypothetical protein QVD17_04221 [Tagetes erecta]|uniref:BZIP domain-containing protein n=1 Tax=Tagetes erecta TaxID=13708 RepID=A0AAD8LBI4_TARER|nr:hypothetical protein QVD17_04221 [Tagetes erecta]
MLKRSVREAIVFMQVCWIQRDDHNAALGNHSVDAQKIEADYPFAEEMYAGFVKRSDMILSLLRASLQFNFDTYANLFTILYLLVRCLLKVMEARQELTRPKCYKSPSTQAERLEKREKRKQCNRESAKRSRMRKQMELENLQVSVEELKNENELLRDELKRVAEECEQLELENVSLKSESRKHPGPKKFPEHDGYFLSLARKGNY